MLMASIADFSKDQHLTRLDLTLLSSYHKENT